MREKGFAGMSVQHVADALEFSKANFFYHIKSKEQLLYDIFVETLNFSMRAFEEILQRTDPPPEKLRAIVDFYVHLMTERTAVMLVWFKEKGHLTPEHEREVSGLEAKITTMLHAFYRDAIDRGYFRAVEPTSAGAAIFGMCFALTRWPQLRDTLTVPVLSAQMQQLACDGLLRRIDREPVAERAR